MNTQPFIELRQVSKAYQADAPPAVKDINLSIHKGQITVIAGESGSGKTTLIKLITGLLRPDSGEALFEGKSVTGPEKKLIPGHEAMKLVAQDFDLNIYASVFDNIAIMLPSTDLKAKNSKTQEAMRFLRIDALAGKRVVDLSGGEQQRVAIARAIITRPQVLVLDEPFSQIDAVLKNELRADLKRMVAELSITIILISHDPVDGLSLADKIILVKNGSILEEGSPRQLYNQPAHAYTAKLLANSNVINEEQASVLGISFSAGSIAVHPEWIEENPEGADFTIAEIMFKGAQQELIVVKDTLRLHMLCSSLRSYTAGELIKIRANQFSKLAG